MFLRKRHHHLLLLFECNEERSAILPCQALPLSAFPCLNAMKSGVQYTSIVLPCSISPVCLNAMKSGVQFKLAFFLLQYLKRFECNEERSATVLSHISIVLCFPV